MNVDTFTVNGTTYSKEDNSLSALQSSASGYVKEGTIKGIDSIFSVDITSTTVYDLYYFWIIVVLFIIIVAILVTAVVYIRKQSKIPEEKDL